MGVHWHHLANTTERSVRWRRNHYGIKQLVSFGVICAFQLVSGQELSAATPASDIAQGPSTLRSRLYNRLHETF